MDTRNSDVLFKYLEGIRTRYQELNRLAADTETAANPKKLREISIEIARLAPMAEIERRLSRVQADRLETEKMLGENPDRELAQLAHEELEQLESESEALVREAKNLLSDDEESDRRNVFLEIRAGTGGDEASLFASELLRMYLHFAEKKGWKSEIISSAISAIGGNKEIIVHLKGEDAHRLLGRESGVHRVQRVPITEAGGRIHTSTVTVAVLPEVSDVEVNIQPRDLRIDTFASSAPGGQHVNRTESAIRITHLPTGLVVSCQDEKSQHKNRDRAMKVLKARLYELERERRESEIAENRKSQIGAGLRSEKIRTYNIPQNRVTDHRLSGRNFSAEIILSGELDELLGELREQQAETLLQAKLAAPLH